MSSLKKEFSKETKIVKKIKVFIRSKVHGTSLVMQWLRICLPMQGTWVRALV